MFRMLLAALRSRIVWIGVGVVTVAGVAFVFTVAVTTAVVIFIQGQDVDPDEFAELATPLGLAAAAAIARWSPHGALCTGPGPVCGCRCTRRWSATPAVH